MPSFIKQHPDSGEQYQAPKFSSNKGLPQNIKITREMTFLTPVLVVKKKALSERTIGGGCCGFVTGRDALSLFPWLLH